jgi:hypothetical protein
MLSKLPDLVPQAIFMIKPSPFGAAIGEGLGGITGLGTFAGKGALQYASQEQEKRYDAKTSPGGAGASRFDNIVNAVGEAGGLTGAVKRKSS